MMRQPHQIHNQYVFDVESGAEMARLLDQDHMTTRAMGGLFPDFYEPTDGQRVLDVACGPGGWVQQVAFTYPTIEVHGVDTSHTMIEYAQAQAGVQRLKNAYFEKMDVTQPLKFPDDSFDFVNARFMVGFLSREQWPEVLQQLVRVTKPGGIVRLTDSDVAATGITSSRALERLTTFAAQACYRARKGFGASRESSNIGITPMLSILLQNAGCLGIIEQPHALNYSAGTTAYHANYSNFRTGWLLMKPFLLKMGVITNKEMDELYEQFQIEMLAEDFRGIWYFLSAWGQKPEKE
jgi:ubiquinone/menaquinone biosynthesis C-methylase UbiE